MHKYPLNFPSVNQSIGFSNCTFIIVMCEEVKALNNIFMYPLTPISPSHTLLTCANWTSLTPTLEFHSSIKMGILVSKGNFLPFITLPTWPFPYELWSKAVPRFSFIEWRKANPNSIFPGKLKMYFLFHYDFFFVYHLGFGTLAYISHVVISIKII